MSKEKECPVCHKVGFHKMSCPTQKVTVFISDEKPEQKEVRKRLIDRAVELQNECEEYMQKIREKLNGDNS
jgi:guanylate kinase